MKNRVIDSRLSVGLRGTASVDELRAARDRKAEKCIEMEMTAAYENHAGAQEPIEDFGGKLKLQICEVVEASTRGGDVKVVARLLDNACNAAKDALGAVWRGEEPEVNVYDRSALTCGTTITFYYREDKHWGSMYRVINDLLPEGEQVLVKSNEYPVPDEGEAVCFFVTGVHHTRSILDLTNLERAANGLEPLAPQEKSTEADAEEADGDGKKPLELIPEENGDGDK